VQVVDDVDTDVALGQVVADAVPAVPSSVTATAAATPTAPVARAHR
jgi:hypothetical protein